MSVRCSVKNADPTTIELSESRKAELDRKLKQIFIRRTKETELKEELPNKEETVSDCFVVWFVYLRVFVFSPLTCNVASPLDSIL